MLFTLNNIFSTKMLNLSGTSSINKMKNYEVDSVETSSLIALYLKPLPSFSAI